MWWSPLLNVAAKVGLNRVQIRVAGVPDRPVLPDQVLALAAHLDSLIHVRVLGLAGRERRNLDTLRLAVAGRVRVDVRPATGWLEVVAAERVSNSRRIVKRLRPVTPTRRHAEYERRSGGNARNDAFHDVFSL